MHLPSAQDYEWALRGLTPAERFELDEVALEIIGAEVDGQSADVIEALAIVFARHVPTCEAHLQNTNLELAACLFDFAARARAGKQAAAN